VYIDKLQIENFRCFGPDQVDLSFDRGDETYAGWTVFAGRNGGGKTTVLRAIALALTGRERALRLHDSFERSTHRGARGTMIRATLVPDDEFDHGAKGPFFRGTFVANFGWVVFNGTEVSTINSAGDDALLGPWSDDSSGWFVAGYGPHRRVTGQSREAQRLFRHRTTAQLSTLFREDATLVGALEWLQALNAQAEAGDSDASTLLRVSITLLDDKLLPEFGDKVVNHGSKGLHFASARGGAHLLGDLSDGYRSIVALVLDLVRSLYQCYGRLPVVEINERPTIDLPGVVLIDEVDAHLHVSWQQRIGFWLKEHFPRIQFIVTSHSPFVCQAADKNGLILLPQPGTDEKARIADDELYYRAVNGPADAALLSDLFGMDRTWSKQSEKKREEMGALEVRILDGNASDADRARYRQLRREIPCDPFDTAEVDRVLRSEAPRPPKAE
jgi:energy-coupling factor transporter ATP-binding protein EcfA2